MSKLKTPVEVRYRQILSRRREGETLVSLAARQGVKLRSLYHWNQKLNRQDRSAPEAARLLPVRVIQESLKLGAIVALPDFEFSLHDSRHLLKVPAKFDQAALRSLIAVLEGTTH